MGSCLQDGDSPFKVHKVMFMRASRAGLVKGSVNASDGPGRCLELRTHLHHIAIVKLQNGDDLMHIFDRLWHCCDRWRYCSDR